MNIIEVQDKHVAVMQLLTKLTQINKQKNLSIFEGPKSSCSESGVVEIIGNIIAENIILILGTVKNPWLRINDITFNVFMNEALICLRHSIKHSQKATNHIILDKCSLFYCHWISNIHLLKDQHTTFRLFFQVLNKLLPFRKSNGIYYTSQVELSKYLLSSKKQLYSIFQSVPFYESPSTLDFTGQYLSIDVDTTIDIRSSKYVVLLIIKACAIYQSVLGENECKPLFEVLSLCYDYTKCWYKLFDHHSTVEWLTKISAQHDPALFELFNVLADIRKTIK